MSLSWFNLVRKCMPYGVRYVGLACLFAGVAASDLRAQQAVTAFGTSTDAQQVMPTNGYSSVNNSMAELEARIRELEAKNEEQQTRFASLLAEDKKKEEKKDDKASKGIAIGSDLKMSATYKNGLELETANKDFKIHVRGREQFDYTGYTDNSQPNLALAGGNGGRAAADFRRLRTGVDGTIYEFIDFAVELDWVNSVNLDPLHSIMSGSGNVVAPNGAIINTSATPTVGGSQTAPVGRNTFSNQVSLTPAPTDVWFNFREVPLVGNIRVGSVKQNLGLEHQNSSRFLDFMERNLGQDAWTGMFNNGFAPGILAYNWNEEQTATASVGLFKYDYNVFSTDAGSSNNEVDTRFTWTPIYDEESHGRYMMHMGFGAAYRGLSNNQLRVRARPSLRNGISALWPVAADTGTVFGQSQTIINPEWAMIWGRWHFQAEYFGSFLEKGALNAPVNNGGTNLGTVFMNSYYVQATYFLTGEHREYERKAGAFGRVVPHENFFFVKRKNCGPILTRGAWQVGYRYEVLDLRSNGMNGGVVQDQTIGLNHFLNPNMKVQYNFVYASSMGITPGVGNNVNANFYNQTGDTYGFGVRLAHDF